MMLSLDTAYRSFGGEVEASSTPTICRLSDSRRHQLWTIAPAAAAYGLLTVDNGGYMGFVIDWNTTPALEIFNGTTLTAAASANTWHALQAVLNTTSSVIRVDGTDSTGLTGGTQGIVGSSTIRIGSENGAKYFSGLIMETGYLAGTAFSSQNRIDLNTNMHAA